VSTKAQNLFQLLHSPTRGINFCISAAPNLNHLQTIFWDSRCHLSFPYIGTESAGKGRQHSGLQHSVQRWRFGVVTHLSFVCIKHTRPLLLHLVRHRKTWSFSALQLFRTAIIVPSTTSQQNGAICFRFHTNVRNA
jgi:hypothetical protein